MTVYYENTFNTPYHMVGGFAGWILVSRYRIAQTGNFSRMYDYNHGMSREEFHEYLASLPNFTVYDDDRFKVLDELIF